mmetsp:Transcript_25233/g.45600  ORF Transcript_25233/g.45600 Transcript_25233/m.45600 type:complete len:309 (-) Transcript_25233:220-1146(-)
MQALHQTDHNHLPRDGDIRHAFMGGTDGAEHDMPRVKMDFRRDAHRKLSPTTMLRAQLICYMQEIYCGAQGILCMKNGNGEMTLYQSQIRTDYNKPTSKSDRIGSEEHVALDLSIYTVVVLVGVVAIWVPASQVRVGFEPSTVDSITHKEVLQPIFKQGDVCCTHLGAEFIPILNGLDFRLRQVPEPLPVLSVVGDDVVERVVFVSAEVQWIAICAVSWVSGKGLVPAKNNTSGPVPISNGHLGCAHLTHIEADVVGSFQGGGQIGDLAFGVVEQLQLAEVLEGLAQVCCITLVELLAKQLLWVFDIT